MDPLNPTGMPPIPPPVAPPTPGPSSSSPEPGPAAPPAAPTPPPAPKPDPITPLIEELTALRLEKMEREAEAKRQAEANRIAETERLASAGKLKELMDRYEADRKASEEKARAAEAKFRQTVLERELAAALAGQKIRPGTADQLMRLWRDDFEVIDSGGRYEVRSKDMKTPAQVAAERLASPEWDHFVLAEHRGGAAPGGAQPQPTPVAGGSPALSPEQQQQLLAVQQRGGYRGFGL